jgi:hypothetical protein
MNSVDTSWVAFVGGLSEIAIDSSEQYVLVLSPSGRALYELATGERVARDRAQPRYDSDWLDEERRRVRGIGPLEGEWLEAVGLWGGGLPTRYGTLSLSTVSQLGAGESVVLHTGEGQVTLERGIITEIRALGFVRGGATVVLATSSDLSVFAVADSSRLQRT